MKEEKKHPIDKLFKDGLTDEGDNITYQANDWEAMDQLLGGGQRPAGFTRRLPVIISAIAAMLILLLGWLFLRPAAETGQNKPEIAKATPIKQKDPGNYGRPAQQPAEYLNSKPLTAGEQATNTALGSGRISKSFFTLSAAMAGRKLTGSLDKRDTTAPANSGVNLVNRDDVRYTPMAKNDTALANYVAAEKTDTVTTALVEAAGPATTEIAVNKTIVEGARFRPAFAISVVASSDLNSVQTFSRNKVGTSAGLILTMGLSKKWSISAGAVYADKPYTASFAQYTTPYKFAQTPSTVDASCVVLDVPVNIGYQFYQKGKTKLSIGTGLSSYFMLRENYTFNYGGAYPQPASTYNIRNKNQHVFGVLNLNATYQRRVSSKLDIGLQPYVKLPLTNIGYGQVDLKSAGVAASLMWNFNSHTKPK